MTNCLDSKDQMTIALTPTKDQSSDSVYDVYSISRAEAFIQANKGSVIDQYRQKYHASAPVGWINDPNGLCYFAGSYHLYCQYNPYDTQWGPMHWGHWVSDDLVTWRWKGVALSPDTPADAGGCYSGTAVSIKDCLYLMYTGISWKAGKELQQQCIAYSFDGFVFQKESNNPVITGDLLPEGFSDSDFRDPKVYRTNDGFQAVIAGRENGHGKFIVFSSPDLRNWKFESVLYDSQSKMIECPDIFTLNGQTVLICGIIGRPWGVKNCPHNRPAVMYLGSLVKGKLRFQKEKSVVVDYGTDFYAPQTILTADGRRIMIGWMQNWDRRMPTDYLSHGWNGCMSLPRELSIEGGELRQRPLREIEAYRNARHDYQIERIIGKGIEVPSACELLMDLKGVYTEMTLNLFENGEHALRITIDPQRGVLRTDSSESGLEIYMESNKERQVISTPIRVRQGDLQLRIFLDTCSAEVFVNDGQQVVSTRVFPNVPGLQRIRMALSNDVHCSGTLTVYQLGKE